MSTTRVITAFTTRGKKEKITTNVATWGELKPLLERQGIEVNKLLATENQNKADLVNDLAVLPTVDFVIFFRPKETKSGAELSYKETRAAIKEAIERDGDFAKDHFNQEKNYTTKSASELTNLLNSYVAPSNKNVADVVEDVKNSKKDKKAKEEVVEEATPILMKASEGLALVKEILTNIQTNTKSTDVSEAAEIALKEVEAVEAQLSEDFDLEGFSYGGPVSADKESVSKSSVKEDTPSAEDIAAFKKAEQEKADREAAEKADREENERLEREMRGMGIK